VRGDGRTHDGSALDYTIVDAERSVCIAVMDFAPVGLYAQGAPVWWPRLFDALLHAVLTKRCWVRLLVSKWAHTSPVIDPFLRALQLAADGGRTDGHLSGGLLEIKFFALPGWDSTLGANRKYPGHSRVNHVKYVVTDRRANIGTSNMTWDYFSSTAGMSLNTDHRGLMEDLQTVFDRDWTSRYASRLS